MKKVLIRIAIGLGAVVALFVVVGLLLPSKYTVTRSIETTADADTVYAHVARVKDWTVWTAWTTKEYPDLKFKFQGPESGTGAEYSWTSESTGNGSLKITRTVPDALVEYELAFDGDAMLSYGKFTIEPPDGRTREKTRITWTMSGELGMNPINRWFGLFLDRLMGPDFEKGLKQLAEMSEKEESTPPEQEEPDVDEPGEGGTGDHPAAGDENKKNKG